MHDETATMDPFEQPGSLVRLRPRNVLRDPDTSSIVVNFIIKMTMLLQRDQR